MERASKRVFYVRYLAHIIYADTLARRPDVRLDKLENDSPDDVAAPILAGAHAYQIGSARDEIAPKYHADRDLLRRAQSLLIVSTGGAGYDTSTWRLAPTPACWWSTRPAETARP